MSEKSACVFWLAIDENGDFDVHTDRDDVADNLSGAVRCVQCTMHIAPPADVEVVVDIPDQTDAPTVTVA